MNKEEFAAQEAEKNVAAFGRWASTTKRGAADALKLLHEPAPRNEIEALQHGNALANTGNYPVGTSECFNVGIAGGCGPECFVYLKGECSVPYEMLPSLDDDGLRMHAELYGSNPELDINLRRKKMKATIQVELHPFTVPNFVRPVERPGKREDGFAETVAYPLSDLDSLTLDRLCEQFRNEVFRKAGKEQPPSAG